MKKLLIILSIVSIAAIAQNAIPKNKIKTDFEAYYKLANQMHWAFYNNRYQVVLQHYAELSKLSKPRYTEIEVFIKTNVKLGALDEANKWIEYSIENFGMHPSIFYRNDYGISEQTAKNMAFYSNAAHLLDLFYTSQKSKTESIIEYLSRNDKLFRFQLEQYKLNPCIDNKHDFAMSIANQFDTLFAEKELLKIIKEYNFPNEYDIGSANVGNLLHLLKHTFSYTSKQHRAILDSALYQGKLQPEAYATLSDIILNRVTNNTLVQKDYGTVKEYKNGRAFLGYINDVEHVDERRKEICLMPLWMDAKINGYNLSDQYLQTLKKQRDE